MAGFPGALQKELDHVRWIADAARRDSGRRSAAALAGGYHSWPAVTCNKRSDLYIKAERRQQRVCLELDGPRAARERRLLTDLRERFRDVHQGPNARLLRLRPA